MLKISGKVANIFTLEGGKDKDGNEYGERHKVQLVGNVALPSGGYKLDLMDLTVDDVELWKSFTGKNVSVDVGAFAPSKGNIIFFVSKGAQPVAI